MKKVPSNIHFTKNVDQQLDSCLKLFKPDRIAILVDENTLVHCLPKLSVVKKTPLIQINSGEKNKNIETCNIIWQQLTDIKFTRKSLLINLGGGVIGDMGGFVAATFKRGIQFINIPTTLLSQVDASIGGKLGIDFNEFKNHIGVFKDPDAIIICDEFLSTLGRRELKSGFAEVIKHGLIYDLNYWKEIRMNLFSEITNWQYLIKKSVFLKADVIEKDPFESGLRKILNFGHTLGHGIESWYLDTEKDLLHGEAIAAGMIMEAKIALGMGLIKEKYFKEVVNYIDQVFDRITLFPPFDKIKSLLRQDKKNHGSTIMFSLINGPGSCLFDIKVNDTQIEDAINFYLN
jgi:3-dehydroquinate synthase